MKAYSQFLKELPSKKVVFAFGRFQPPTTGHELLVQAVQKLADAHGAAHFIYASRTQDKTKNPLPVDRKVYYLKRMFPGASFVAAGPTTRTFIEAAKELNKKYKDIIMVAGSDRVAEYKRILEQYNGKEFHFDTVQVVSAGDRDPDSDDATGMSGTKMRDAAKKGNFALFKKGLPSTLTTADGRRLMNEIRDGLGLNPVKEEITLQKDWLRESYFRGEIFKIGQFVECKGEQYEILDRGSNYLTLVDSNGGTSRKWIQDVTLLGEDYNPPNPSDDDKDEDDIELSYKGYRTKNFNVDKQVLAAFQRLSTLPDKDPVAILNAIKATDTYLGIHQKANDEDKISNEDLKVFGDNVQRAQEYLIKLNDLQHHADYINNAVHEINQVQSEYHTNVFDDAFGESLLKFKELSEMKFSSSDKIKVARIIADALGVPDVEKNSSPEQLINNALRKIRNKPMRPEYTAILKHMLTTAREAGIEYDAKLVPATVTEAKKEASYGGDYQDMVKRVGERAKQGPMKTVWVPHEHGTGGRYKVVPVDHKPVKESKQKDEIETSDYKPVAAGKKDVKARRNTIVFDQVKEQAPEAPSIVKHRISVTVSDPDHTMVSKRKEKIQKTVIVKHSSNKEGAQKVGEKFYKKKGYIVHDSHHAGMVSEETEQIDEISQKLAGDYYGAATKKHIAKVGVKPNMYGRIEKDMGKQRKAGVDRAMDRVTGARKTNEEYEQILQAIDEALSVVDKGEYDYEGAMARTQLQTICRNAEDLIAMLKMDENIPEWVQSKITLSQDYITSVRDYLQSRKELGENTAYYNKPSFLKKMSRVAKQERQAREKKEAEQKKEVKEEVDLEEDIKKEYDSLKKNHDIKSLRGLIKTQHKIIDTSEFKTKDHAISHYLRTKHGDKKVAAAFGLKEDAYDRPDLGFTPTGKMTYDAIKRFLGVQAELKTGGENPTDTEANNVKDTESDMDAQYDVKSAEAGQYKTDQMTSLDRRRYHYRTEEVELQESDFEEELLNMNDVEHIIEAYDDEELIIVDEETGEELDTTGFEVALQEASIRDSQLVILEISRMERIRRKQRFARTKSKREVRAQVALKRTSNQSTINKRSRKLAIAMIKKRMLRKDPAQATTQEKERVEKFIQTRKGIVDRLARRVAPRVRQIEKARLQHKKATK